MTEQEFNTVGFTKFMKCYYKGEECVIAVADFDSLLIGILPKNRNENDEVAWMDYRDVDLNQNEVLPQANVMG
jgi:hypothetical protein